MDLGDLKTSKFLKKEDVGRGVLATITGVSKTNVAMEGAEPDYKAVLHFRELDKPLVLNSTNGQVIAKITGQEHNIDQTWIGARIVLFVDPNVAFGGKITGGIRVRAPKVAPAPAPAPTPPVPASPQAFDPVGGPDDADLPF